MLNKKDKLVGLYVVVPTSCTKTYEIEYDKLKDHIRWLIDQGIREGRGLLLIAGAGGEGYHFFDEEYAGVLEASVEAADGKVPLAAGIFDVDTRQAIKRIKTAEDIGIDFIQLSNPHLSKPTEDEVYRHIQMINEATEIGILIYNTPWASEGFELRPKLMSRLSELNNVLGIKWDSFELANFSRVLRIFSERFNFFDNRDIKIPTLKETKGFVTFFANIAPKLELKLWELLKGREYEKYVEEYTKTYFDPVSGQWPFGTSEHRYESLGEGGLLKAMMEVSGKAFGPLFPPKNEVSEVQKTLLKETLIKCGLIKQ